MTLNSDEPVEGNWYELPSGEIFTVVTVDEDDGIVEIQYDDATLDEIDLETWEDLGADPIDPPDEWAGDYTGFDEDEDEDLDYGVDPDEIEEE